MADRVALFIDYQNVYRGAREAFHAYGEPRHWCGQVDPLRLGHLLVESSPYERTLQGVYVYRGLPDGTKDPKGHGAASRQVARWTASGAIVTTRPLRYPRGYPRSHQPGERPQEKGIDVQIAIDFVMLALRDQYDVGILASADTDLKPALEAVLGLEDPKRVEVLAWSGESGERRRLAIPGHKIWCHWLDGDAYERVADATDYNVP